MRLLVSSCLLTLVAAQFNIPLPFGGLTFNKGEDGKVAVGVNNNVNILGFGGRRNFTVVAGNGTFETHNSGAALVNGTEFGGGSSLQIDKEKGVDAGSEVQLGDKPIKTSLSSLFSNLGGGGGGGNAPGSFLSQLFGAIKDLSNKTKKTESVGGVKATDSNSTVAEEKTTSN